MTSVAVPRISWLCSLIEESLPQFAISREYLNLDKERERERELLISLSQVLIKIRRWTNEEQGSGCGNGNGSEVCNSNLEEHDCLTNIVTNLISLLNVKSQYVQHLVANIFLVIPEFLVACGSNWNIFINLLCICFDVALCNCLAHSMESSVSEAENSKSLLLNLSHIKSRLNNSTWNTMAGILGILRGIIKLLKGEDDDVVGVLWNSLSTSLTKIPWDVLNGTHDNSITRDGSHSCDDALLVMKAEETEPKILFLGNLVQLLCSLVGLTGFAEAKTGSSDVSSVLDEICEFVPRLLHWCLAEEWSSRYRHILPYFEHKILMLMIRLSSHMQLDCSILVQWLELLHKYYQDMLSVPTSQLDYLQDDILEGSPFLLSLYDQEIHHLSSLHIKRQAVFLFLRCSLNLVGLRKLTTDLKCSCMKPYSFSASNLIPSKDCFAKKKGLLELYGWLQGQVPLIMLSDNETYQEKCIKFASSFIRLYISEDDILFEVLLQIVTMPLRPEKLFLQEGRNFQGAEDDILFHISNLLNPLLLFHVFLVELQYDHQLLLDYLISKDTGSKCAEYLLRCLRTVSDSWTLFTEIAVKEKESVGCQKSYKRRRVFCEDPYEERSANTQQSGLSLSSELDQEEQELGNKFSGNRSMKFEDVKACLLSLKSSLKNLHRRKLFPYNPEVLIRRLTRFEELCNQHV